MVDAYNPPKAELQDRYGSLRGQITVGVLEQLRRSKPWVRLISVTGIVFSLFSILPGIAMLVGATQSADVVGSMMPVPAGLFMGIGIVYIVFGIISLLAFVKLFIYASSITKATNAADAAEVETALRKLAGFWKYAGILTLIMIILFVIGIVAAIVLPSLLMPGGFYPG